ncbi:MAG: aminopeptidase [Bacilli bacterium]|nr:aminopeptidase [Bacilli bacterium]
MNQETLLKLQKYASLVVKVGVNVQPKQLLVINSPVDCAPFTRLLVEEGYKAGAKNVMVRWSDDINNKTYYTYVEEEEIKAFPDYLLHQFEYIVREKAAVISISAPTPGLLKDVNPKKMQLSSIVMNEKVGFYRKHMMGNGSQWCVIAYPTIAWAVKVFPNLEETEAFNTLLDKILEASRVRNNNDPVREWEEHIHILAKHNRLLNEHQFESLHFKNALGTDLTVHLVENHIWGGGGERSQNDVMFAPNIPTEETFTMPHKHKVNGRVVSTKPLNYQGKLIEDFTLDFVDGKVVGYDAKSEKEALKSLLELDEGSSRLGEVALISYDSPISKSNILFFNTLFDENASCHLALGNAYTMNVVGGHGMSDAELEAIGYNKSIAHVDFMFGSRDMEVVGTKKDGTKVILFQNGNFVI